MSLPLVTCLCLTIEGRGEWLQKAVRSFLLQDYPNRELLIVPDSPCDVGAVVHVPAPEGVSVSYLSNGTQKLNVGQKRNAGCAAAGGELIAILDDDDYSAPNRLSQQIAEIHNSSKAVTGYRCMKFTDGANWWQFSYPRGLVLGTSLLFTKAWWKKHPFLEVQIGGDEGFASDAAAANQLAECPDLNLMYATIHPGNTSKRKLHETRDWVKLPGFQWKEKV